MDDERENPFTPGAGEVPPHRAGHEAAVRELNRRVKRIVGGRPGGTVVLYGPRGNGKTALLRELGRTAKKKGARVAMLDTSMMTGNPDNLAKMLKPWKKIRIPLIGRIKAKAPGVEGEVEFRTPEPTSLGNTLRTLLEGPLVLMVDEAHDLPPSDGKALLQISQRFIGDGLPLLLLFAGTPGVRANFMRVGASFWERARRLKIGRLETRDAARKALSIPVKREGLSFAEDALELLVDESQNYPFFIQFLGEQAWEAAIARDPGTDRIELEDAQAGVSLTDEHRRDFYKQRRDEAETRGILPEAEAISKAFDGLDKGGVLSEAQLKGVVRPALSKGRTAKAALEELSALGLVWEVKDLAWEQGIPSLCAYLAKNAET